MGVVYASVASSPTISMPSTEVPEQRLALRERSVPQELPEVGHVSPDLLARRQVHPPLFQLTLSLLAPSRQLVMTSLQRQYPGRQRLHRQLFRLQRLVEVLQPHLHVPNLRVDRLQPPVRRCGHAFRSINRLAFPMATRSPGCRSWCRARSRYARGLRPTPPCAHARSRKGSLSRVLFSRTGPVT